MHRPIIIDPALRSMLGHSISSRRPDLDIREPDNVVAALEGTTHPRVLVTSNYGWEDRYIDSLSSGDWVSTVGAGYDNFPLTTFAEANITFTNSAGVNAQQVAEHVFATALSFTRNLWTYREQQQAHDWTHHGQTMTDFAGDTCCIIGLGNIGEAVAERATAFGMSVRGVKRTVADYDGVTERVYHAHEFRDALADARLLVIAVPLTEETQGLIDGDALRALADDAIVVNVARGPVLVTEALLAALRNETLRAACLDVTDPEPLPQDNPLWDREDVLITPHCAGLSQKYPDRFFEFFFTQYERWCEGIDLENKIV